MWNGPCSFAQWCTFPIPTPCSPDTVPPARDTYSGECDANHHPSLHSGRTRGERSVDERPLQRVHDDRLRIRRVRRHAMQVPVRHVRADCGEVRQPEKWEGTQLSSRPRRRVQRNALMHGTPAARHSSSVAATTAASWGSGTQTSVSRTRSPDLPRA